MSISEDFADIQDVFVEPDYRRRGIANKMLTELLKTLQVNAITLEVRESNVPAIALYEKYGFEAVHIRKNYYKNGEDALLMRLEMSGNDSIRN